MQRNSILENYFSKNLMLFRSVGLIYTNKKKSNSDASLKFTQLKEKRRLLQIASTKQWQLCDSPTVGTFN
jgi:hypothetical protein